MIVESFKVHSCADGSMRVYVQYTDGCVPGVFTRLALASDIEQYLIAALPALNWIHDLETNSALTDEDAEYQVPVDKEIEAQIDDTVSHD